MPSKINTILKWFYPGIGLKRWIGLSFFGVIILVFAAGRLRSDEFIGFFELAHLDNTEEIEVGYRIHKKYWNKGYATEMTKVLIDYEFNIMKLDQIAGITHPENIASQKVLTKSGLIYVTDAFFYDSDVKYYEIDRTKYKMIGKLNIRNNVKSK